MWKWNRVDNETARAMIKFVIGLHRIRHPDLYARNGQVGLPDWFPYTNNGGTECDMARGFCSCGASHNERDLYRNIYVREKE